LQAKDTKEDSRLTIQDLLVRTSHGFDWSMYNGGRMGERVIRREQTTIQIGHLKVGTRTTVTTVPDSLRGTRNVVGVENLAPIPVNLRRAYETVRVAVLAGLRSEFGSEKTGDIESIDGSGGYVSPARALKRLSKKLPGGREDLASYLFVDLASYELGKLNPAYGLGVIDNQLITIESNSIPRSGGSTEHRAPKKW
jgi:hypothetical protein